MRTIPVTYGIREEFYCLGKAKRRAYGIVAYSDIEANGTATVIASVADVTDNRAKLAKLVRKCNDLELDPIHLGDVVEDFIG